MPRAAKGFSLIELLIVLVIIGFLFVYLITILNPKAIINRVKNVVIRSSMSRTVLAIESFRSAYNKIPNEQDFFSSLREGTLEFEESCRVVAGFADGECLFLPRVGMLPSACDTSFWRSDGEIGQICYIRYYAGPNLGGHYRLYAKSWNEESEFFVYDDSSGLYLCPAGFSDLYSMESCKKI